MRIFGTHRHLKLELLSEYLDGRLNSSGKARIDRELASCAVCREELDSLQATVSLLERLPDMPLPRSFTLAAAPTVESPVQRTAPSSAIIFRVPNWVYAGAASLAGLALAVLVSADATGLLTSEATLAPRETAGAPSAVFESQAAAPPTSTPAAVAKAQPEQPVAAPPQAEELRPRPADADVGVESQDSVLAEKSLAPPSLELPQAAEPGRPEAATARAAEAPEQEDAPAGGIAGAATEAPAPPAVTATPQPVAVAKRQPEAPLTQAAPVSQLPITEEGKTATMWRILEGVAAGLGLVFLLGLILKWRRSQRSDFS